MSPAHRPTGPLREPYESLKKSALADIRSAETSHRVLDLISICLDYLADECQDIELISEVTGKRYFSFAQRTSRHLLSRPINRALFEPDRRTIKTLWQSWAAGVDLNPDLIGRLAYTMAITYCAASELFD